MAASAFDLGELTAAARSAGYPLPAGWRPIPERIPSSLSDSDLSTKQTVKRMCELIGEAQADPLLQEIASHTNGGWANGLAHQIGWDVFWFSKHKVRFVVDEAAVLVLFNERDQVDFLISPSVLMRMKTPAGDCDDFTMLACTLLSLNAVPWELVTIACDPEEPGRWSHIYLRIILEDGRRQVIDPTNGPYPGWEVPARDIQRKRIWNMQGQPVKDSAVVLKDLRMHAYIRNRRRGLGQDQTVISIPGVTDQAPADTASPGFWSQVDPNKLFAMLGSIGTRLGSQALLPAGSSLTPQGAIISPYASSGALFGPSGGVGFSIGNVLLFGGIAVVALIALSSVGGRK